MEDKDKILDEIFSNDPLGLLEVKLKSSNARTADERLSASFEEINSFYEKNNRAPEPNTENISEYQLYSRLKGIREDENKYLMLEPQDKYDLLKVEKKEINSIDDIFGDDLLGIFSDGEEHSLFEFKHTPRELARAEADFIARRKPCKNFRDYEGLFKNVQDDLATGKRKLIPFKETQLKPGNFYINNGVLLYLESIDYQGRMWKRGEAENNRIREFKDGRTNTIFENGTMSNMLFRSLAKTLILNGKSVTENSNIVGENIIS
ncbi:MAG: GIY-YIG nuclease family protein, partial [Bacteroidetes bacterium]|nr:GIY-YIG nuclease family protein [Bacteroidota bacterium]